VIAQGGEYHQRSAVDRPLVGSRWHGPTSPVHRESIDNSNGVAQPMPAAPGAGPHRQPGLSAEAVLRPPGVYGASTALLEFGYLHFSQAA
jgi:hypothetical protein